MNQIPTKQNTQKQLERLAAQKELYSAAKYWHGWQIGLTVVLPVCLALLSLFKPDFSVYGAIYGFISFIVDVTLLEPAIKKRKAKAAKIQEMFDCDVLELPKSPLKTVDDITVEEVLIHYNAHVKIPENSEKIKDWYPKNITSLPLPIARVLCQRTNCWWDSKLREKYSGFLRKFSLVVLAAIIFVGFAKDQNLTEVTLIASGLIPFFQFCSKQYIDNLDAAKRLTELVLFSKLLWEDSITRRRTDEDLEVNSRRLQDEIFEHRSKSPLILDLYYGLFRDEDEALMNRATESLVEEALAHYCQPQ